MSLLISQHTEDETIRSLAAYLPGGELFESAYIQGTNFNALLAGLSGELLRSENFIFLYNSEFIPDQTTVFIEEWESAVGIPDDCFPATGTNEVRRLHILTKLASLGVQTVADFENLAVILGFPDTVVTPGIGSEANLIVNGTFDADTNWDKGLDWTISGGTANKLPSENEFPLEFPIPFGGTLLTQTSVPFTPAVEYVLTYDIVGSTEVAGVEGILGGTNGVTNIANGTHQEYITGGVVDTDFSISPAADFDGSIDNISLNGSPTNARFTIIVNFNTTANLFPLIFPIAFGADGLGIMQCLFTKLKPANCDIVFIF